MQTTVTTNWQWRETLSGDQIPPDILADDFDWCDKDASGFFQYRGRWYNTQQFERLWACSPTDPHGQHGPKEGPLARWAGMHHDSFFSGVVINLDEDGRVQVGTAISA